MFKEIDELLLSSKFIDQRGYWLNKLSLGTDFERTELLFKSQKNREGEKKIEKMEIPIPDELFSRLMKLGKQSELSLYIILLTALKLLIFRYTQNEDVIIASSIYKRNITAETMNDRVFIRDSIDGEFTFIQLLLEIRKSVLQAYENQDYPYGKLIEHLFNTPPTGISSLTHDPLSDIVCLLSDIHDNKMIENEQDIDKLIFSFERKENHLNGHILYDRNVYERASLHLVSRHFVRILENSTRDVKTKVSSVSFSSREEDRQFIIDFNQTRAEYPKEKTLVELFEEQVERSPGNLALVYKDSHLTYRKLNERANQLARRLRAKQVKAGSIVGLMVERSHQMFIGVLAVLKAGGAFLPIDDGYPEARKQFILKECATRVLLTQKHILHKEKKKILRLSIEEIICVDDEDNYSGDAADIHVIHTPTNLSYIIYTSGTSGKPKGVMVNHQSIVNYIWWAAQRYVKNGAVNFPLYTSISFDLTLTSIFTPLLTGNAIMVYGEEEKEPLTGQIITENKVGVVKLTPSHLELIKYVYKDENIPTNNNNKIKCLIVGGEKLASKLALDIYMKFNGDIEIYNEYGPTEATVGCMIYRFDPANDHGKLVPIGSPINNIHIYILDRELHPVPFGIAGELCIGGVGVVRGYLNRVELTSEKFIESPFIKRERLYRSGDLARRLPDGNIEFLGRMDKQVKIRGYRIELDGIRNQLLTHPAIKEAVVIDRESGKVGDHSDAIGDNKYLCAYIVSEKELESTRLKEYLFKELPDYMVPLYFVHIDRLPLTLNGKVDTKALPLPKLKLASGYVPPRDSLEERLVKIWAELLGAEKGVIGINTNFFEIGGNSLNAILAAAKIHKEINVKVPLVEIFKNPMIKNLAKYIKGSSKEIFISINAVEQKEYYALSSAQQRLYFLQQMEPTITSYNIPIFLELEGNPDIKKIEETFRKLIQRHESLRSSFELMGTASVQRIHENVEFEIQYNDVAAFSSPSQSDIRNTTASFIRPFDLSRAPLLRVSLIKTGLSKHLMSVDMHHIISDGVSMEIFVEEFFMLYRGEEPPQLNLQYKDYTEWQNTMATSPGIKMQEDYWLSRFAGKIPTLDMPTDYPRSDAKSLEGDQVIFEIAEETIQGFKKITHQKGATLNMSFLAVFYVLLLKYTDQQDIIVGVPVAGRHRWELFSIMGVCINTLAMRNYPSNDIRFSEFLDQIIKNSLDAYQNQDYPFDTLVEKLKIKRHSIRNPLFDVMFELQNYRMSEKNITSGLADLKIKPYGLKYVQTVFDLLLVASEIENKLRFSFYYRSELFKKETIQRMSRHFENILVEVTRQPDIKLAEINMLDKKKKIHTDEKIGIKNDSFLSRVMSAAKSRERERAAQFEF